MAHVDEAFVGVGQEPGLIIWRIEKLKVVRQDPKTYGDFYSGDSYILLNTKRVPNSSKLEWDIHFWLGKDTSQDEKGVAAYKTVELDDSLGGGPVQHREVQEHESQLFMSYFKKGIRYMEGGVESGFKKVERDKYETRLLQLKGKRNVRVHQVEVHCDSLNQGDVFILDCGLNIYVWIGPKCSNMEKIKGAEVAKRINDEERGARAQVHIVDKWNSDPKFFKALGSKTEIKSADEGGDDKEFERVSQDAIKLYRVSDASGELEVTEVGSKPLKRELLESEDCFILDSGPSGIYVWVGKSCTKNEKKSAWANATEFLTLRGYPDWTPITQVVEGGETPLFKQYFSSWKNPQQSETNGVPVSSNVAKYSNEKFDASALHQKQETGSKEFMPDDGSGSLQMWRVTSFDDYEDQEPIPENGIWHVANKDLVEVPPEKHGIFYTGDCYIILYTYKTGNRDNYLIYFWQGTKSTTDEKGASAIFAQRLDDQELGGAGVQIRVVQGREPEHFLQIFKGRMIILMGGINNEEPPSDVKVFHIRGTNDYNTRAIQVLPRAASLNSNDVFLVETDAQVICWLGQGASEEERRVAGKILQHVCPGKPSFDLVEGEEPEEFWDMLGGREPYATGPRPEENTVDMPPRLFQCSNASGRFRVEEIVNFCQEDLCEDDVMLLDTFKEIFVWVGKGANAIEKRESLETAMAYVKTDPAGRNPDNTMILQVKQGFEPPNFTCHFHAWDASKWSQGKTYEEIKKELGEANAGVTDVQEELNNYNKTYSLKELKNKLPPVGVDPAFRERHLSDKDFDEVFGMTKEKFNALPKWKQLDAKKKAGLF